MPVKITEQTALKRFAVQVKEVQALRQKSIEGGGMNAVYTDYITCQGTQPGRLSGEGHEKCGKRIQILFAYKCLYCDFWFCASCAEIHFGKTRKEFNEEMKQKGVE